MNFHTGHLSYWFSVSSLPTRAGYSERVRCGVQFCCSFSWLLARLSFASQCHPHLVVTELGHNDRYRGFVFSLAQREIRPCLKACFLSVHYAPAPKTFSDHCCSLCLLLNRENKAAWKISAVFYSPGGWDHPQRALGHLLSALEEKSCSLPWGVLRLVASYPPPGRDGDKPTERQWAHPGEWKQSSEHKIYLLIPISL